MRKLVGLFVAGIFLVSAAGIASAEGDGPNFTFGASTSIGYDLNDPDAGNTAANALAYSSQEQDESFNIDLVQLGINGQRGALSYAVALDFGDLAAAAGDSADGDIALQTAYISYDFDGVGATVGRFGTPIGYEVLEPWGNAHISRSNAWQLQPINHDGITVSGSADVVDLMIGVVNSYSVSDSTGNDGDDEKGIIGSIGAGLSDEVSLYLAGIYTEEGDSTDVYALNLILSGAADAGDTGLSYAFEGNLFSTDNDVVGDNDAWNITGYVGTDAGPIGVDIRADYTKTDSDLLADDVAVWSISVTGTVPLAEGVDFRVEYRHDDADADLYGDDDALDDSLDLIQAQLVWHPEAG
jgi:hypothetical protein